MVGKEMIDDRFAHWPGGAHSGLDVHQQTGPRIDFNNGAALFSQRP